MTLVAVSQWERDESGRVKGEAVHEASVSRLIIPLALIEISKH